MKYKHIELFAGCGGMTLGLESAGFELYCANELSPMAAETFSFNILKENLRTTKKTNTTLWIKSNFPKGDIRRLIENPNNFSNGIYSDFEYSVSLDKKLIVGDIYDLLKIIKSNNDLKKVINKKIDIISGGPPCQSFSLAGRRDKNNSRNMLPWAFADFVEIAKPKLVLLENVSGILRAFREGNKKYHAWFEVAKAFCIKGYIPICMHINAKYFGLPQNRPRYLMLGIRSDVANKLHQDEVLLKAMEFYNKVKITNGKIEFVGDYSYYELNSKRDINSFLKSNYLPSPKFRDDEEFRSVEFGIDKLKYLNDNFNVDEIVNDPYAEELSKLFPNNEFNGTIRNHNHRKHSNKIQKRFRFIKLIEQFENGDKNKILRALKNGSIIDLDYRLRIELVNKFGDINDTKELDVFFNNHQSKKHSQRALVKDKPAPAALSIPDDVCHYSTNQDRTLTVREMARIQSFPDWFEFRAKDTTGGKNRRHEVPNYTQVGNAVPPILAYELGLWMKKILKSIS